MLVDKYTPSELHEIRIIYIMSNEDDESPRRYVVILICVSSRLD
jgi:hypothetical protein